MCSCVHPPTSTLQVSRAGMSSFPLYLPLHLLTRTLASHSPSLNIDGVIFQGCQAQHSNLSETAFPIHQALNEPPCYPQKSSFALGIKTDQCPRYALNSLKYTSQIYVHMMCMKATASSLSPSSCHSVKHLVDLVALLFPLKTPSQNTRCSPAISPSESFQF